MSFLPRKVQSGDTIKASTINCILNALEDLQRVSKGLDLYKLSSPTSSPRMAAKNNREPFKVSLIEYKDGVFKFNISTGHYLGQELLYPYGGITCYDYYGDDGELAGFVHNNGYRQDLYISFPYAVSEYDYLAYPCTCGITPFGVGKTLAAGECFGIYYDIETLSFTTRARTELVVENKNYCYNKLAYLLATITRRKCSSDTSPSFCVVQKWRSDIYGYYTTSEVYIECVCRAS